MFSKGILTRYADSLTDPEARETLHAAIRRIRFDTENGVQICSGGKAWQLFDSIGMNAAFSDLRARLVEFIDPAEHRAMQGKPDSVVE